MVGSSESHSRGSDQAQRETPHRARETGGLPLPLGLVEARRCRRIKELIPTLRPQFSRSLCPPQSRRRAGRNHNRVAAQLQIHFVGQTRLLDQRLWKPHTPRISHADKSSFHRGLTMDLPDSGCQASLRKTIRRISTPRCCFPDQPNALPFRRGPRSWPSPGTVRERIRRQALGQLGQDAADPPAAPTARLHLGLMLPESWRLIGLPFPLDRDSRRDVRP
jgi:hypothetical protein